MKKIKKLIIILFILGIVYFAYKYTNILNFIKNTDATNNGNNNGDKPVEK
jgi:hypothetical protein